MVVVERLTVRVWLTTVLPMAWRARRAGRATPAVYWIDTTGAARRLALITGASLGVRVEPLTFRLVDVRDERGALIRLRIAYADLARVQADVVGQPPFQRLLSAYGSATRLGHYVAKSVATLSLSDRSTLWRGLLLVQIARWHARRMGASGPVSLVLERRAWVDAIERYATAEGVTPTLVRPATDVRAVAREAAKRVRLLRTMRDRLVHWWLVTRHQAPAPASTPPVRARAMARIAVQYHGQFNLDDRAQYSDLFFWQESALEGRDLVMLFPFQQDPLDDARWAALQAHGIGAVGMYPGAVTATGVALYSPVRLRHRRPAGVTVRRRDWNAFERRWLHRTEQTYWRERDYWAGLFRREGAKLYTTWQRFDAQHLAIADGMRDAGGVTAVYQRAYQSDAAPEIAVDADLMFGYAPADADVEARSGSRIGHHVAVGYFGDHRFPLIRQEAAAVRASLAQHGARYVVAFFDENSADDPRWHTGHAFMRDNYVFLLDRVLEDPDLGLLLKPKIPATLVRRLGPVAEQLRRALATGRCRLFDAGTLQGAYPPAAAALAADIAIHGHLCAATAGLEAALAGVPTLLMDREGWPDGRLHALGPRAVFTDWPAAWEAVSAHRRHGAAAGIGDWSALLAECDPFRDGRGAERMGTYLKWVLDHVRAGAAPDVALADAAERYARAWGADKIRPVGR